jgi:hypothetical protein
MRATIREKHLYNKYYTGRFIMFSVITNIYNQKTTEATLMGLFAAKGKLKTFFFFFFHFLLFFFCIKLVRILLTSSSAVNGRPLDICLHRHPVSVNCLYHARIVLSAGGSFAYLARNARCTVTTDLLVWYSDTQNFSPGAAIFSLHTLALPSGRNVNYD